MGKIMSKKYTTFKSFYPFYLSQHSNPTSRKLHYLGTSLVIGLLIMVLIKGQWLGLLLLPLLGYFFAWVGHFFFEKNTPATFTYPLYSLRADFLMLFEALTGRLDHSHFSNINSN
jgi:hypothetical protein